MFREPRQRSTRKQLEKDRLDPVKSHKPEPPVAGPGDRDLAGALRPVGWGDGGRERQGGVIHMELGQSFGSGCFSVFGEILLNRCFQTFSLKHPKFWLKCVRQDPLCAAGRTALPRYRGEEAHRPVCLAVRPEPRRRPRRRPGGKPGASGNPPSKPLLSVLHCVGTLGRIQAALGFTGGVKWPPFGSVS